MGYIKTSNTWLAGPREARGSDIFWCRVGGKNKQKGKKAKTSDSNPEKKDLDGFELLPSSPEDHI